MAELDPATPPTAPQAAPEATAPLRPEQAPSSWSQLRPGTLVSRYEIVEALGSGAMGVVYRARDAQLSRDLAIKLLHAHHRHDDAADEHQGRLLREAQALAQLSHPNVVAAYDVGTHDGSVFIAMELVDGVALNSWASTPRTPAQLLRVLIAAGRGLAAAHAAGVLHRDFKPDNVMVSADGRPRVVDFGLARGSAAGPVATAVPAPSAHRAHRPSGSVDSALSSELTAVGVLVGTPGYMAPEQLVDSAVDARADQFGYAATVFRVLVGERPHPGRTLEEYRRAVVLGDRTAWPRSVPRRVRRIVDRGLATAAADRYPTLTAMVDALERAAAPRRGLVVGMAALALGAGAVVAIAAPRDVPTRVSCQPDDARFAGVWDAPRRAALAAAFHATGRANADEAFGLLGHRLDGFAARWQTMRRQACEATLQRGEQSERMLGLQNACLDDKLRGVAALVDAFAQPDAALVDRAAGTSPESLDDCADTTALLGAADSLPADPSQRMMIDEIERGITEVRASLSAARWQQAIDRARSLFALAPVTGHARTRAHASGVLGRALFGAARSADERDAGERILRDTIRLAAEAADDELVASTASYLFVNLSYGQRRLQEAQAMQPTVEAAVIRAGNAVERRIELGMGKGQILRYGSHYQEAKAAFEEVMQLAATVDTEVAGFGAYALSELGVVYVSLGDLEGAVRAQAEAVERVRARFGASHPRMIVILTNLARAQSAAGHRDEALASIAAAHRVADALPEDEPRRRHIPLAEGQVWRDSGDVARALAFFEEALPLWAAVSGAGQPGTAEVEGAIGSCLVELDRVAEAIPHLERCLTIRRAGDADDEIAEAAQALGEALWSIPARRREARALMEEALARYGRDVDDNSALVLPPLEAWLRAHP